MLGGGGREHALAWKVAQSAAVSDVFVAPGNAGTQAEAKVRNVALDPLDFPGLASFCEREAVALTIVGPEQPLVDGVRDFFDARGLACFGPTAAAARLEGSKAYAKAFLARYGIPTARYETFDTLEPALAYVRAQGAPLVVKADGLAAGKGVVVAQSEAEALEAVRFMLAGDGFGSAGHRVVIEEFLPGEEASFICLCDGTRAIPFATSQDHKPRDDGDRGPNTGGMGAYSPAPVVTDAVHDRVMREIIEPTMAGMAADGHPYQGFLYAGLMIDAAGAPRVVEFNCRFGDPEAQPVLLRLDSDLIAACQAALDGRLQGGLLRFRDDVALGVVLAAGGYPGGYRKGDLISGLETTAAEHTKVFHAGTARGPDGPVTNGGRVLCVAALGSSVAVAQQRAYEAVHRITWPDVYYRNDIGYRAVQREAADA